MHKPRNPCANLAATHPATADKDAAQAWMEFQYGWMADPVYFGDYPASMKSALGSSLPKFTPQESELVKGSMEY